MAGIGLWHSGMDEMLTGRGIMGSLLAIRYPFCYRVIDVKYQMSVLFTCSSFMQCISNTIESLVAYHFKYFV